MLSWMTFKDRDDQPGLERIASGDNINACTWQSFSGEQMHVLLWKRPDWLYSTRTIQSFHVENHGSAKSYVRVPSCTYLALRINTDAFITCMWQNII